MLAQISESVLDNRDAAVEREREEGQQVPQGLRLTQHHRALGTSEWRRFCRTLLECLRCCQAVSGAPPLPSKHVQSATQKLTANSASPGPEHVVMLRLYGVFAKGGVSGEAEWRRMRLSRTT